MEKKVFPESIASLPYETVWSSPKVKWLHNPATNRKYVFYFNHLRRCRKHKSNFAFDFSNGCTAFFSNFSILIEAKRQNFCSTLSGHWFSGQHADRKYAVQNVVSTLLPRIKLRFQRAVHDSLRFKWVVALAANALRYYGRIRVLLKLIASHLAPALWHKSFSFALNGVFAVAQPGSCLFQNELNK